MLDWRTNAVVRVYIHTYGQREKLVMMNIYIRGYGYI